MEGNWGVFLDKDGTLLQDVPYNVDPREMRFAPGAQRALRALGSLDIPLIVVSNQPGVALGRFATRDLVAVKARLARMFRACGARLQAFYYCPHHPEGQDARFARQCACRKPAPGMLRRAGARHRLDLRRCWMIGDILDDVEAGRRAGCRTILIGNGNETVWRKGSLRSPHHIVRGLEEAASIVLRAHG